MLYLQWLDGIVSVWFPGRADDEAPEGLNAADCQHLSGITEGCWNHHAQLDRQGKGQG